MKKRSAVIVLLLLTAALAVRWQAAGVLEPRAAIEWLRALGPWSIAAYVLGYIVFSTLFVPAFACHIVAGVAFGLPQGVLIALLGANVASHLQFFLGRALGAERVTAWLQRRGWAQRLDEVSVLGLFVIRVLPTPFIGVNVGAGASGMKWRHFLVGSGLGLIPQVVVHTFFAAQLYEGVEGARTSAIAWAVGAGLVLVAGGAIGRWVVRRRRYG